MVLVVYGFATQTAALQFEWAWQHPDKSLDTRDAAAKVGRKARYGVRGKVLMLMEMLNASPWKHYPLKIQFLKAEHVQLRAGCPEPPQHVTMSVGPLEDLELLGLGNDDEEEEDRISESGMTGVTCSKVTGAAAGPSQTQSQSQVTTTKKGRGASACCICSKAANRTWAVCFSCSVRSHIGCLAEHFLSPNELNLSNSSLPARGNCPACGAATTWTDVLATMKHAGWAKHKKKADEAPTITEVDEEVDMELPSVPSSPKRVKRNKKLIEPKTKIAATTATAAEEEIPASRMPLPSLAPAPAAWMDSAPPNWNCGDAIAAALERTGANITNTRQRSSSCSVPEGDGAAGSSWPIVEEAAPWNDYCQSNASCSDDENENVIDLVSPAPLKNSGDRGGAGRNGDNNVSKNTKEIEVIELLSSSDDE